MVLKRFKKGALTVPVPPAAHDSCLTGSSLSLYTHAPPCFGEELVM